MPLYQNENLPDSSQLLVWKLDETEEELLLLLPTFHDNSELQIISHPQKRREWLASRIVIRMLAEMANITYQGLWKDEHGKPFLIGRSNFISITHTTDFVAGVIHPNTPVGVDMEKKTEKLIRIAHKFLSDEEAINAGSDIGSLCMLWCSKEALFKLNGRKNISLKTNITVQFPSETPPVYTGMIRGEDELKKAVIHIRWIENYCLAIAL
jgi:4'-phosphopantetheinyl transferase